MLDHCGIVTKKKCTNVRCEQPSLQEGGQGRLLWMQFNSCSYFSQ